MSLTSKLIVAAIADLTNPQDLATGVSPLNLTRQIALASGVGASQADLLWHDQRTILASANEEHDLAGSLVSPFGAVLTFARIKALIVSAAAANVNNVVVGGAAATQWVGPFGAAAQTVSVRPGGIMAFVAPDLTAWPVGAGASDLLRVANSGAGSSVTYDIVIIGASA